MVEKSGDKVLDRRVISENVLGETGEGNVIKGFKINALVPVFITWCLYLWHLSGRSCKLLHHLDVFICNHRKHYVITLTTFQASVQNN